MGLFLPNDANEIMLIVLLDTNSVLNAALLPKSFSARAIELAHNRGACSFLVSAGVMRETKQILSDKAPDESHYKSALDKVDELLSRLAATKTSDDDLSTGPACIPKPDWHVFHAARRHGAAVLTSDAELWLGLRELNMPSLMPLEWMRQLDGMAVQTFVFGERPSAIAGSVFFRAYPGSWSQGRSGKFSAASCSTGFWLYYDAKESCWSAEIEGLEKIARIEADIQVCTLQTVSLSWEFSNKNQKIEFRVAGVEHPVCLPLSSPLNVLSSGSWSVGSCRTTRHFWNCSIYSCITNDRMLSKLAWKKCLLHRELTPNPFDSDRLAAAILQL